jgi:hypothetical protein
MAISTVRLAQAVYLLARAYPKWYHSMYQRASVERHLLCGLAAWMTNLLMHPLTRTMDAMGQMSQLRQMLIH